MRELSPWRLGVRREVRGRNVQAQSYWKPGKVLKMELKLAESYFDRAFIVFDGVRWTAPVDMWNGDF
jgi:hypothetical protein